MKKRYYKLVEKCPYPALRDEIASRRFSLKLISEKLGMSYQTFRGIADGSHIPNLVYAQRIASYYGKTTDEMFPAIIVETVGGF